MSPVRTRLGPAGPVAAVPATSLLDIDQPMGETSARPAEPSPPSKSRTTAKDIAQHGAWHATAFTRGIQGLQALAEPGLPEDTVAREVGKVSNMISKLPPGDPRRALLAHAAGHVLKQAPCLDPATNPAARLLLEAVAGDLGPALGELHRLGQSGASADAIEKALTPHVNALRPGDPRRIDMVRIASQYMAPPSRPGDEGEPARRLCATALGEPLVEVARGRKDRIPLVWGSHEERHWAISNASLDDAAARGRALHAALPHLASVMENDTLMRAFPDPPHDRMAAELFFAKQQNDPSLPLGGLPHGSEWLSTEQTRAQVEHSFVRFAQEHQDNPAANRCLPSQLTALLGSRNYAVESASGIEDPLSPEQAREVAEMALRLLSRDGVVPAEEQPALLEAVIQQLPYYQGDIEMLAYAAARLAHGITGRPDVGAEDKARVALALVQMAPYFTGDHFDFKREFVSKSAAHAFQACFREGTLPSFISRFSGLSDVEPKTPEEDQDVRNGQGDGPVHRASSHDILDHCFQRMMGVLPGESRKAHRSDMVAISSMCLPPTRNDQAPGETWRHGLVRPGSETEQTALKWLRFHLNAEKTDANVKSAILGISLQAQGNLEGLYEHRLPKLLLSMGRMDLACHMLAEHPGLSTDDKMALLPPEKILQYFASRAATFQSLGNAYGLEKKLLDEAIRKLAPGAEEGSPDPAYIKALIGTLDPSQVDRPPEGVQGAREPAGGRFTGA